MGNAEWPQRMSDSLKRNVGEKEAELIIEGCDKLCEMDEKNRAKWMAQAMGRLDSHVADEKTKIKIMTDCCCRCYEEHILELRRVWKGTGDVDALIDVMTGKVFLRRPERDGNIVYVTKAPRFPEEHAGAKTKEEKKYYFCHCDYARAASAGISKTYCLCGAGWCKRIWEEIMERPIRVDVVKAVLQGDNVCRFAVYL